jgi:hypothetical protein
LAPAAAAAQSTPCASYLLMPRPTLPSRTWPTINSKQKNKKKDEQEQEASQKRTTTTERKLARRQQGPVGPTDAVLTALWANHRSPLVSLSSADVYHECEPHLLFLQSCYVMILQGFGSSATDIKRMQLFQSLKPAFLWIRPWIHATFGAPWLALTDVIPLHLFYG